MDTAEWHEYPETKPPMDPEYDFGFSGGGYGESIEVLALVHKAFGPRVFIARLKRYTDDEFTEQWVMQGRDGYILEGVTHWRLLPPLP
jgi:hypothetical protein